MTNCRLEEIMGIKDAADYSGLSQRHVRLLLETGKIKGRKLGHDWVTLPEYVDAYLQSHHKRGRKPKSLTETTSSNN